MYIRYISNNARNSVLISHMGFLLFVCLYIISSTSPPNAVDGTIDVLALVVVRKHKPVPAIPLYPVGQVKLCSKEVTVALDHIISC